MKRNCMTQKELADRWTISHRTLERWRWAGEGPAYMKLGGRVVYPCCAASPMTCA